MTYKDQFVAEVKCKGRILRIKDGYVTLPFGSEYSLLFKNLNSRKVAIGVEIDGTDAINDKSLILGANQSMELEGFLEGMSARNRFKFIQKTNEIVHHRGDKIDDGLIRIQFAFEKPAPKIREIINEYHHHHHHHHTDWWIHPYRTPPLVWSDDVYRTTDQSQQTGDVHTYNCTLGVSGQKQSVMNISSNCMAGPEQLAENVNLDDLATPLEDMGITVKGSVTSQLFNYGSIGQLEDSQVIVIQLKGITLKGEPVAAPVTVKTKLVCSSCGMKSVSTYKFCPKCGTFLE